MLLVALLLGLGAVALQQARTSGRDTGKPLTPAERAAQIEKAKSMNGPIFEDWPRPKLALLFSGELDGYIEPCGCAGIENQKGGLKRRHTLLKQLREQGWPVVALDMGGQIRRFGPQANIKFRYIWNSLIQLGYQGIGLGASELKLETDAVLYVAANLEMDDNPLLSANVALFGFDSGITSRYRVIEAGGKRIGVTSVLGKKYLAEVKGSDDLTVVDPAEALKEVAPQMAAEKCDLQVLMVHGDPDEAAELSRSFPQFQWVATTGGAEEPPNHANKIEGSGANLVEVGHKGMYVAVIGFYDDPQTPVRYQRVPVDARFDNAPEMQESLVKYQAELKALGFEGLGLEGIKHPEYEFIGSDSCVVCHTKAAEVFEKTKHAHATQTLMDLVPPRHNDPECISCHVVGWDPQRYFPYKSGYWSPEKTPQLRDVGCENCHGPGAAHVAAESGEIEADDTQLRRLRRALRLKILVNEGNMEGQKLGKAVKNCLQCHDLDNSPEFDFQKYWPHVEHEGKD